MTGPSLQRTDVPSRSDIAVAAGAFVFCVVGAALFSLDDNDGNLTPVAVIVLLAQCAPLAYRRRFPITVWWVTGVAASVYGAAEWPDPLLPLGALLGFATVVELCPRWIAIVGWFVSLIAASISMVVAGDSDAVDVWVLVVMLVFGPMLGEWQRTRNAYMGELHAAAARSEADRERDVRAAQLAERAHLARELHDVVAHHVSMMVVQAEAGASSATASSSDGSGAVAAFDAIAANGRLTLGELRTLLDVLRTDRSDRAPTAPQPGIDAVDALVRQAQATGMSISLSIRGERRPLPPAVDLSAYRAVQEGLTNVVKHGEGAHADVSICFEPGNVRISVVDDGAGGTPTAAPGHGLDGLRERVRLLDGTMTAGPRPAGGFELSVALPAGR